MWVSFSKPGVIWPANQEVASWPGGLSPTETRQLIRTRQSCPVQCFRARLANSAPNVRPSVTFKSACKCSCDGGGITGSIARPVHRRPLLFHQIGRRALGGKADGARQRCDYQVRNQAVPSYDRAGCHHVGRIPAQPATVWRVRPLTTPPSLLGLIAEAPQRTRCGCRIEVVEGGEYARSAIRRVRDCDVPGDWQPTPLAPTIPSCQRQWFKESDSVTILWTLFGMS